jgi:hypothetical protein
MMMEPSDTGDQEIHSPKAVPIVRLLAMKRLALLLTLSLLGCTEKAGEEGWTYCYVGTDATAKCFAQKHEQPDDMLYALDTCKSGGGLLRDACPDENRLGYCESVGNAPTSAGFKPRTLRIHEYRHPDVLSDEVVESIAKRCNGTWVPANTARAESR